MKRCIVFENINQQLAADQRIHGDSGLLILLKNNVLFHNDQRTGLYFPHCICCMDQFTDCPVRDTLIHLLAAVKRNQI